MSLLDFAQYTSDCLAAALIIRLLTLRLHSVYRVFCAFLIVDLISSLAFLFEKFVQPYRDYRITWMILRPVTWVLILWMVYALLDAFLANLPGLLQISRKVLNVTFIAASIAALGSASWEYWASELSASQDPVNRALAVVYVLDRVIFTAAVLVLLTMVALLLWFPVQMPRNLAVFTVGFVVYFASRTVVLIAHNYIWGANLNLLNDISTFALAGCYAYWLIFIGRAGELRPVRMGHSWQPEDQRKLIRQLEAMNHALVQSSQRQII